MSPGEEELLRMRQLGVREEWPKAQSRGQGPAEREVGGKNADTRRGGDVGSEAVLLEMEYRVGRKAVRVAGSKLK